MKRYCKNIDITDRDFIENAVYQCLKGKLGRNDTIRMLHEYSCVPLGLLKKIAKDRQWHMFDPIIQAVIDGIRQELLFGNMMFKKIWYTYRVEGRKRRRIGIQDIKQQLYDYIAVNGLSEMLMKKIGYYQCAAIPGKGQVMGMRAIKRWLRNKSYRYAWKGDAKHYYENIPQDRLMELLSLYVKNDMLIDLVRKLVFSFEKGLSIGSYLSQYLANFYMSFGYHEATERTYKIRNCRDGQKKRVNLLCKVLIYMDDILFIGKSMKDIKMAVSKFREWIEKFLCAELKDEESYIDLRTGYIDMMGFKISRNKVTVRSRIFLKFRKSVKRALKNGIDGFKNAQRIMSRYGWLKNCQCRHYMKKNNIGIIIKICKEAISNGSYGIRYKTA